MPGGLPTAVILTRAVFSCSALVRRILYTQAKPPRDVADFSQVPHTPMFRQLLLDEEFQYKESTYRLLVYRVDGGLLGRWRCNTCEVDSDHDDCLTFASVERCRDSMRRAIRSHDKAAHCVRSATQHQYE